jgi:hypothetical protein
MDLPVVSVKELLSNSDTCWALIERIAGSSYFKRATRLRDLLLFIGSRQIKEHRSQLHEQEIGIEVFGRAASYDTNIDNIVRANMSELRKRIEIYFEGEGNREPLLVEIPRGSYRLAFRKRVLEPVASQDHVPSAPLISYPIPEIEFAPERAPRNPVNFFAIFLILALCAACTTLWIRNGTMHQELVDLNNSLYPWRNEPTVAAFWSTFLSSPQDTDVVIPDAALGQMEYYAQTSISLRDYVNRSYLGQLQSAEMNPDVRTVLGKFNSLNFVTLSAIKMAERILALDPLSKRMHLYFSREYIPSFIDRDNVILLGDPVSNPFIQLIENQLNFTVERVNKGLGPVVNHAPVGQEQSTYVTTESAAYCVVAYLPNPGHSGRFLLIQGTSPAATEAAEFFLLSEKQMAALKGKISRQNSPYFEVLLRTSQVTGTPLAATIEAYRVHPDQ